MKVLSLALLGNAAATVPACLLKCVYEVHASSSNTCSNLGETQCIFSKQFSDLSDCFGNTCPSGDVDAAKSAASSIAKDVGASAAVPTTSSAAVPATSSAAVPATSSAAATYSTSDSVLTSSVVTTSTSAPSSTSVAPEVETSAAVGSAPVPATANGGSALRVGFTSAAVAAMAVAALL